MAEKMVEENTKYDGAPTPMQIGYMFTTETKVFWKGVISTFLDQYSAFPPKMFFFVPQSEKDGKDFDQGRRARWGVK